MRVRKQTATGDYVFGQGAQNFYVNIPAAVAQQVQNNLMIWAGEWYLNTALGMTWATQVLGFNTEPVYDTAIKAQITSTDGVAKIVSYVSSLDDTTRALTINTNISTIYSNLPVELEITIPLIGGYGVFPYGTAGYGE